MVQSEASRTNALFSHFESGYQRIYRVKTLVCNGIDFEKCIELECEGEWKNDTKYGLQFQTTACRDVVPETLE